MSEVDRATVAAAVRARAPLVHCITAAVSMGLVADGLLAVGARPMMTETAQEAPTLVGLADALLVNLGALSVDGAQGIPPTVAAAVAHEVPWVLDPAAIGVAPVRTALARALLDVGPAVIRGNASEILCLAGEGCGGRGPDTLANAEEALGAARRLARHTGAVVAVSGVTDLVTDGTKVARLQRGSALLSRVTGTGCLLGAVTAACLAVVEPFAAALTATTWLAVAGEYAERASSGPGSFRVALLDALDQVTDAELRSVSAASGQGDQAQPDDDSGRPPPQDG